MPSIPVTALFTIIGAAIGAGMTLFTQLLLRKEKFKEIIYKERLDVFNRLLKQTTDIAFMTIQYENFSKGEQNIFQMDKLARQVLSFHNTIGRFEHILSKDVHKACGDLVTALNTLGAKGPVDEVTTDVFVGTIGVTNAIRADLGIDKITKSIPKTINFLE